MSGVLEWPQFYLGSQKTVLKESASLSSFLKFKVLFEGLVVVDKYLKKKNSKIPINKCMAECVYMERKRGGNMLTICKCT